MSDAPPALAASSFGSWRSPLTTEAVAAAGAPGDRYTQPALTADGLFWVELRPQENGRSALMRARSDGRAAEVGPPGLGVASRVHELGGGAYAVHDGTVWLSSDDEDRVYRVELADGTARPITPAGTTHRYGDLTVSPDGALLLAVRERHDGGEAVDELVALPADGAGEPRVLAGGRDFYAAPRVSPDGRRIAFLSWDHPRMPWDGTELSLATLTPDGLDDVRVAAGGEAESIFQPSWSPAGELHLVSDRSGWWNLYRLCDDGELLRVAGGELELGVPQWELGLATYAFLDDGTICCLVQRNGATRLGIATEGRVEDLGLPYRAFPHSRLTARGRHVAFVGAAPDREPTVVRLRVPSRTASTVRAGRTSMPGAEWIAQPRRIAYESEGLECFMSFYAPRNPDAAGAPDERPPLIVNVHGGPTFCASASLDLGVQFWTSRGFAFADVDYGGSSGLGRAYRERLRGQWGLMDVRDAVNAAAHLAAKGLVDPRRHVIRGMSAGGYTTLQALATTDAFMAGASWFGIADMALMVEQTHRFESRYVDALLGRCDDMPALYAERSPLSRADRIAVPLALLHGAEDRIVAPEQAVAMADALRARGVPVTLRIFEGEGHGFRRATTIAAALAAELELFELAIGLRAAM